MAGTLEHTRTNKMGVPLPSRFLIWLIILCIILQVGYFCRYPCMGVPLPSRFLIWLIILCIILQVGYFCRYPCMGVPLPSRFLIWLIILCIILQVGYFCRYPCHCKCIVSTKRHPMLDNHLAEYKTHNSLFWYLCAMQTHKFSDKRWALCI